MKKLFLLCICLISFKAMFGLSVNVSSTDNTGPGCNNGTIHVHINADIFTNAFKVRITGPGGYANETCPLGQFQNFNFDVSNLASGSYSIEVWRLGFLAPCSGPYDAYIVNGVAISDTPCNTDFNPIVTASGYGCNNGTINFTILNGVNVDYYDITVSSIPSGNLIQTHLNSTAINHTFNNLAAGSYWVTVYEHRLGGCYCVSPSKVVIVNQSNPVIAPTLVSITPANSTICNLGSVLMSDGYVFANLPAGNNLLNGSYNSGCGIVPYSLNVIVPDAPCNIDFNPITTASGQGCNNGIINFTILNGINVTYYDITVSSIPSGNLIQTHLNSTAINHTFNNLASGSYWVTVYAHGSWVQSCYYASPSKVVVVNQVSPPTVVSITPTNSTACSVGSVLMSDGYVFNNLPAGNNVLNGTYNTGCSTANYSLNVNVPATPCNTDLNPTVTASDQGCNNGIISLSALNGINVAYYDITVSSIPSGNLIQSHLGSTDANHTFYNLSPGSYWVTVYEHRPGGQPCYCVSPSKVVDVTETLTAAPTIASTVPASSPTCSDGSVIMSNNDVYYNLPAGSNTLNGTYNAGCITLNYTENAVIPATPCNQITSFQTVKSSAINCGTGVILLELSANANNLIKLLKNGIEVQSLTLIGSTYYFENLEGGSYEVQVINLDQCSCSVSATTTVSTSACSLAGPITENGVCSATFTGYADNFCGTPTIKVYRGNNILVDSFAAGNVFDYTIFKNGNYKLVMTDTYGCSTNAQFSVNTIACAAPINLSFIAMSNNRVKLLWDINSCAMGYTLQYKLQGSSTWKNVDVNLNIGFKVIKNIQANAQYKWRIRTNCSATLKSTFSSIQSFCNGPNCVARLISDTESNNSGYDFIVVPNPASNFIKLNFDSEESLNGLVTICDQTGKNVYTKNGVTLSNDFTIDISNLPAGLYILNFLNENENHAARFIKMN